MSKNCLLISGSPRKGNTDFILEGISEQLKCENELILLRDKKMQHCRGCLHCHEEPNCTIDDDMTEIRDKVQNADLLIIGSPNYFDNVSGLLKDFMDRTHPFYKEELLKEKKVILLMVGGGDTAGTEKYLTHTTYGFVKYLKLDLVGTYCFKALHARDLENDPKAAEQIKEITDKINSL